MIQENARKVPSGYLMLVVLFVAQVGCAYGIFRAVQATSIGGVLTAVVASVIVLILWAGLFLVHPNEAKVLQLFGKYAGTVHDAYSPEIANAMLRRQQASAIISARTQLVAGAVGMVEMALTELKKGGIVELDEERKAAMVSNLLVVLCGEEAVRPVVNTGSLYT